LAHFARLGNPDCFQQRWNQRKQVFDLDAPGDQDKRADRRSREVLLELKVLVASQENFETLRGSTSQQLAIP
jgi:hypothetical protein